MHFLLVEQTHGFVQGGECSRGFCKRLLSKLVAWDLIQPLECTWLESVVCLYTLESSFDGER